MSEVDMTLETKDSSAPDSDKTCEEYESLVACMEKFITSLSDKPGCCKKIAKAFPICYKTNPEAVQIASDQLWGMFEKNFREHAFELIKELQLKKRLCELSTAPTDDEVKPWRSTGEPEKDVEESLVLVKQEEALALSQMLQKENAEIVVLEEQLAMKENKLKEMLEQANDMVEHLEEVGSLCSKNSEGLLRTMQLQLGLKTQTNVLS